MTQTGAGLGHDFVVLYRTQDSGVTWLQVAEAREDTSGAPLGTITTNGLKNGVSFRNTEEGWLTATSFYKDIFVYQTKNGGMTWYSQDVHIPDGYTAEGNSGESYPPLFFDDKNGVMPIYLGSSIPAINLFFYSTIDGGDHWVPTTPLKSATYRFVWSWPDALHGFAAEDGTGILYITSDAGSTWSKSTVAGVKFSQMDFISPLLGWALSDGYLVQTVDGGKNWQLIYP